jgi:NADPH:quinone reductase-like Zn-dependent oxidoreductase
MRAALIKAFGEPTEVLELADVPEPLGPAAGEVLVGVEYAPVNMNDLYVIQGAFPVRPSLPSIVGNEGVGRVLAVGGGVEHLTAGDRVLVPLHMGIFDKAYAHQVGNTSGDHAYLPQITFEADTP